MKGGDPGWLAFSSYFEVTWAIGQSVFDLAAHKTPAKPIAFYPDVTPNGMYSTEALHRYNALVAAGFELDLASETGSYVPDTRPIDARFMLAQDGASFKGPAFAVNVKLRAIAKAGEDFFITSGRIVTGANPFSATSTALKAIAAFEAL